ncbi:3,4-dihydroxy-2-butanone-4-phosphate synthase [Candidatus Gracilibacteria bacterium]|nr:3,4-dihydroxy-2-butanone-4-phosphate synthase [Candidatus Gracilibacteria bacterium]MCF7819782.1 3,4-dihydroxy-2-butanone-4-phosphate synthase [Candidatus Gracilibacteria bacterium]
MKYDSPETIIAALKQGDFIIVFDEHREKEGDFFLLAEKVTPQKINFLFQNAKGMICVPCGKEIIKKFDIPLMIKENSNLFHTNFCVSVDATEEITTGVSASDRTKTIQTLCNPSATSKDLVMPGHTFPLLAQEDNGRFGHTEAGVKLARILGQSPAMIVGEILNTEGEIASLEELFHLSQQHGIPITTLEAIKTM